MNNCTISKFLSTLNVARKNYFISVKVEYTKINLKLLSMFEDLGIIRGFLIIDNENKIKVFLKYKTGGRNVIINIEQVSKFSKRIYVDILKLKKMKEKHSTVIYIISTINGLVFDFECFEKKIGGEVLLKITI